MKQGKLGNSAREEWEKKKKKKSGMQGVIERLGKKGEEVKEKERVRESVWECPFDIHTRQSFP